MWFIKRRHKAPRCPNSKSSACTTASDPPITSGRCGEASTKVIKTFCGAWSKRSLTPLGKIPSLRNGLLESLNYISEWHNLMSCRDQRRADIVISLTRSCSFVVGGRRRYGAKEFRTIVLHVTDLRAGTYGTVSRPGANMITMVWHSCKEGDKYSGEVNVKFDSE